MNIFSALYLHFNNIFFALHQPALHMEVMISYFKYITNMAYDTLLFFLLLRYYTLIHITRHFHNYTTLSSPRRTTHIPRITHGTYSRKCVYIFLTKFSPFFYLCAFFSVCVQCTHIVFWIKICTESRASQRYENIFNVQMG